MNIIDWKAIVLKKMGFIEPMTAEQICKQHNGVQAQFQSYADVGFWTRMSEEEFSKPWSLELVRQWSIRGTMHAYLKEEIPLYLYEGRNYLKPGLHLPSRDGKVSAEEKNYYADLILEELKSGNKSREDLKELCRRNQLSKEKEISLFNAWGGIIASLISVGKIYQEYGEKTFGLLEDHTPWEKEKAELEIARRYFSGFGPVSLADARYYFKENKSTVEGWMKKLDLKTVEVEGVPRYYLGELEGEDIPDVLFIAGFDALLLAFEKKENPFFDPKYIRDIYTLTGILKPTVMLNGELVATWRKEKDRIYIRPFIDLRKKDMKRMETKGMEMFPNVLEVLLES
ncbi:MAG: crosslink repair DNA glycosylase YcaQ family protein [Peptostreptococcaceae bacterium]|nr:crosslink repair DNA glycosylase YcaQ family protein [Peptostreptococcaceae bacterium]